MLFQCNSLILGGNDITYLQPILWCLISSPFFCPIQGRLPLTGTTVTRHTEDADGAHYAFDITGLHLKLCRKS